MFHFIEQELYISNTFKFQMRSVITLRSRGVTNTPPLTGFPTIQFEVKRWKKQEFKTFKLKKLGFVYYWK